ncbi:hypothetical protein ACFL27_04555 [candidate division CSSED10-310 bacterium]|uniref:Outer membrane protein beta-barrel domain-containing protein n=1 Tax=candidate division CSSED10-310 bacterium TaxID=2855610 RepID=A0ABV6YTR5_UNCC1
MKNGQLNKIYISLTLIVFFCFASGTGLAQDLTDATFFQFGSGLYMPATDGWDEVYDSDIIPITLGYTKFYTDVLGLELAVGYYAQTGETVEGEGFEPESVDFLMVPLTITGIARLTLGVTTPYAGFGLGGAYFSEAASGWDNTGYTYLALAKGGANLSLTEKWLVFAEIHYSYIPVEGDEKSLSGEDVDFGGLGAILGVRYRTR